MNKSMNRVMKMVIVLMILLLSTNVSLADEQNILVYVELPDDWTEPSLWAWGEDGTNAFDAWPGEKLISDENNPGWFYLYVPSYVSSIIVNANEAAVQTSDLQTNLKNVWVSVKNAEEVVVSNDQMTEGDFPEPVKTIQINAYVPEDWVMPSLWAWSAPDGTNAFPNWPGEEMDSSPDGWYSLKVGDWINSVIINANMGAIQTQDISIEPRNVWIVIEAPDQVTVSYEKPVMASSEEDMITIHAKTPSDWLMPSLWAWSAPDGTNVFPNWPGQELDEKDGWYTYSIPNWVNSIIINGNLGSVQTSDISIDPKDVWVVVNEDASFEVFYVNPDEDATDASETKGTDETEAADETAKQDAEDTNNLTPFIIGGGAVGLILAGFGLYSKKKK